MSLLGRLEDLSIPDIVQIVFLSRRTGMLEIIDGEQRWCIYFRQGRVVAAASPQIGSLGSYLAQRNLVSGRAKDRLDAGESPRELMDAEIISPDQVGDAATLMIAEIVGGLKDKARGEFNFILSETVEERIDYDPDAVFAEGGISPAEVFQTDEQLRPLQSLEESLRAGKALLRGETDASQAKGIGFGEEIRTLTSPGDLPVPDLEEAEEIDESSEVFEDIGEDAFVDDIPETFTGNVPVPSIPSMRLPGAGTADPDELEEDASFASGTELEPAAPFEEVSLETAPGGEATILSVEAEQEPRIAEVAPEQRREAEAAEQEEEGYESESIPDLERVREALDHAGKTGELPPSFETFSREPLTPEIDRDVVLFETNPMIRVAAKRTFSEAGFNLHQYGVIDDAIDRIVELLGSNSFFVTFLDDSEEVGAAAVDLLRMIKKKNRHLPVVIIDPEADLERRHQVLEKGADLYLTKPSPAHLQPNIATTSLGRFGEEMLLFCKKAIDDWKALAQTLSDQKGVGEAFYEIAEKERTTRSRNLVRHLIDELSDPDDITTVADTILRLASGWLDRGVLFVASPVRFIGLGGFGETGTGKPMFDLARRIWIARDADSVLRDAALSGKSHRGKMKRTETNVKLVEGMGRSVPSEVIVIPITDGGEVAGILYGDNGGQRMPLGDTKGLEFFIEQAGLAFRNAVIANARRKGIDWNE